MATLDIFVSFEFDKDRDLRDSFYEQAKLETQHRVRNCSLREACPREEWKRRRGRRFEAATWSSF